MIWATRIALIGKGKQDGTQSLHRAVAVLRMVAKYNADGVKLSKVSRDLKIPPSTVHRILSALVDEGMVCFNAFSKRYNLGFDLYLLGSQAGQYALRDQYHDLLDRLAQETEDTVFLVIKSGYDVLCIDRVVGSSPIQVLNYDIGDRRPLGVGAGSLAILASLPDDEADHIIRHNERKYQAFKGFAPDDLKRMIGVCRQNGYAANTVTRHWISVGVCLCDQSGDLLGAVSVSGIDYKMTKKRQKEMARLIQTEINRQKYR